MALVAYEADREKIDEKVSEIRSLLGERSKTVAVEEAAPVRRRHRMSAAERLKISGGQAKWKKKVPF
jgi:hypothetical protein